LTVMRDSKQEAVEVLCLDQSDATGASIFAKSRTVGLSANDS